MEFLKSLPRTIRKTIKLTYNSINNKSRNNYGFGRYNFLKRNKINNAIIRFKNRSMEPGLSETHLSYLKEIIYLCNRKKINLTFISITLHPYYLSNTNETKQFFDDFFK